MTRSFYDKPIHKRVAQRVLEGALSTAIVYLFSPQLLVFLAPIQAYLNAAALNRGQSPPNQGISAVANTLIQSTDTGTQTIPANTTQGI